jgi:hypothetical protein
MTPASICLHSGGCHFAAYARVLFIFPFNYSAYILKSIFSYLVEVTATTATNSQTPYVDAVFAVSANFDFRQLCGNRGNQSRQPRQLVGN